MTTHPDIDAFNRTVWAIVRQVPGGIVTTYGQIASMIPRPDEVDETDYEKLSPRWVGDAMNAVSRADNKNIPWWRVINGKGGVSLKPEPSNEPALSVRASHSMKRNRSISRRLAGLARTMTGWRNTVC